MLRKLPQKNHVKQGDSSQAAVPVLASSLREFQNQATLSSRFGHGAIIDVRFSGTSLECDLTLKGHHVWRGIWSGNISVNGEPLGTHGNWSLVDWRTGDDADLLELEQPLSAGWRICRHIFLAKRDQVILLADTISGEAPSDIEYEMNLPLTDCVQFVGGAETREGVLQRRHRDALVIPLALPEWRAEPASGELRQSSDGLQLRQRSLAKRMFVPLFLDLDPQCARRPTTWRRLTVAEHLQPQPNDVAVGYRVQVGADQWLIYRSLARPGNRTLLGHNLVSEFLVGRFGVDGKVRPILDVERRVHYHDRSDYG